MLCSKLVRSIFCSSSGLKASLLKFTIEIYNKELIFGFRLTFEPLQFPWIKDSRTTNCLCWFRLWFAFRLAQKTAEISQLRGGKQNFFDNKSTGTNRDDWNFQCGSFPIELHHECAVAFQCKLRKVFIREISAEPVKPAERISTRTLRLNVSTIAVIWEFSISFVKFYSKRKVVVSWRRFLSVFPVLLLCVSRSGSSLKWSLKWTLIGQEQEVR